MIKKSGKVHYAWFVCAGCALLLFCTSGLSINAFTIYQPYFISLKHFSNTQASALLTFRYTASLASMFVTVKYYKRLGMRRGMTLSGAIMVLSFVLYGIAEKYWQYCAAAVLTGIGYGTGTMIPIAILLGRWFKEKKDTAIGICSSVTGISTLGIPSLIARSVETRGLRFTFCAEASVIALLVFFCRCLLRNSPEEMELTPYGSDPDRNESGRGMTGRAERDLSKGRLAVMLLMLLFIGGVMSVSYSHLAVLITGEGQSEETAALAMSVSGFSLMLGKMAYGRLEDLWGTVKCNKVFAPVFLTGITLCCFIGRSSCLLYPAIVLYSFGMAYMAIGLSTWPAELSTPAGQDRLIQLFQIGYAAGSLVFSPLPGILADRFGGSYVPSFILFLVLGAVVFASVQRILKKQTN